MILDSQGLFNSAQAVFASGATVQSTNVIDLARIAQDIGNGEPLFISMTVTTAFSGGTTITVNVVTDDNAGMASTATITPVGVFTPAQLAVNTAWVFKFPIVAAVPMERYLGMSWTTAGVGTAGSVTTALCRDATRWAAYPKNYPVA